MKKIKFNIIISLLTLFCNTNLYAIESLPAGLISFTSQQGFVLFKKDLNLNALKLLSQFTTQETGTYCGVASAVMILNAVNTHSPVDAQHEPYHYFTQENFFDDQVNKIITADAVKKSGMTLAQLAQVIQLKGLTVKPYYANDIHSLEKFRQLLANAISKQQFIIVNFLRSELNEQGPGHHSPIAAYDKQTDRFLLLDVARYKYSAYWVRTVDLWRAVNTIDKDNGVYRGLIIINSSP